MRLAVLRSPKKFEVVEAPLPDVGPNDVLVRVTACGVCASDLPAWSGAVERPFPAYFGHEVGGVVEAVGSHVASTRAGTPVAVLATSHGFAEYVAVPEEHCVPVLDTSVEVALAEPLGCAVNAVEAANVRLSDDVVIVGAGFMGNLVHQLTIRRGPRHVVVADTRPEPLARARELGATLVVDVTKQSLADVVRELTDGEGADVTFEVTGTQRALDVLGATTRMSGRVVLVGAHQGTRDIPLGRWNWMAYDIINGHVRTPSVIVDGMCRGMRLLDAGKLSLANLATHRFGLDDVGAAFEVANDKPPGFVKSVVVMGSRG